jgi:hypothetical protein
VVIESYQIRVTLRNYFFGVSGLEVFEVVRVCEEMTFYDWWKEGVHIINNRAGTLFAQSPVLVVLVNDEDERAELVCSARVADWLFALNARRSGNLFGQDYPGIEGEVNVPVRLEDVDF